MCGIQEAWRLTQQNLDIEVSAVSASAVKRIEQLNGRVTSVYHSPLGKRALLKAEGFDLLPKFARPNHRRDVSGLSGG